jgi:hypothetical protein
MKNEAKCKIKYIPEELKHKITIISDIHVRECAEEIKHNLILRFEKPEMERTSETIKPKIE